MLDHLRPQRSRRRSASSSSLSSSATTVKQPSKSSAPPQRDFTTSDPSATARRRNRWSLSTSSTDSHKRGASASSNTNKLASASPEHSSHRPSVRQKQPEPVNPQNNSSTLHMNSSHSFALGATGPTAHMNHPGMPHLSQRTAADSFESLSTASTATPRSRVRSSTKDSKRSNDSIDNDRNDHASRKQKREKAKRELLSKALARANEAVALDNNQDYTAAIVAYEEACEWLSNVLSRSTNEEDQRKLSSIRDTYVNRAAELQRIHEQSDGEFGTDDEAAHPDIRPSLDAELDDYEEQSHFATAVYARPHEGSPSALAPPVDDSGLTRDERVAQLDARYRSALPAPLTLRPSPDLRSERTEWIHPQPKIRPNHDSYTEPFVENRAGMTNHPWLTTVQENRPSSAYSETHSFSSNGGGVRRKTLGDGVDDTEAEFDAALDAAVEAAYNDGYEAYGSPISQDGSSNYTRPGGNAFASRDSNLHPEHVSPPVLQSQSTSQETKDLQSPHRELLSYSEDDSEEEERLLDQVANDPQFAEQRPASKGNIPRQSGSSGFSYRTHPSSVASSSFTNATAVSSLSTVDENSMRGFSNTNPVASLSTVDENSMPGFSSFIKSQAPKMPPPAPPPTSALPPPPPVPTKDKILPNIVQQTITVQAPTLPLPPQSPSVQERRGSGSFKPRTLKIETTMAREPSPLGMAREPMAQDAVVGLLPSVQMDPGSDETKAFRQPVPSPHIATSLSSDPSSGITPATATLTPALSFDSVSMRPSPQSVSPGSPFGKALPDKPHLRKNVSSLSLKAAKSMVEEVSPGTPMSFAFATTMPSTAHRAPLNTPLNGVIPARLPPAPSGDVGSKMQIFDGDFEALDVSAHPPRSLEPCPESTLLRPFWLLRCVYQTLSHPRGGYLSNKLFIPRDVWKVKHSKLKGVEDKVSNLDLLTAALRKLAAVDTLDAEAVLEEMQSFETVLDQVQQGLSKRLGNEVGVQHVSSLFKEAPVSSPGASESADGSNKAGDTTSGGGRSSSKNFVSSWRKLRNKSSATGLATSYTAARETPKDGSLNMATIPMTSGVNPARSLNMRARGDGVPEVAAEGPNAAYMGALARLCEASQILDQIARQVEDPGLKASSPQYVGLELSVRHAAEFYGFYVCRFVLQDLMALAEKFIKKASEWVMT